MRRRAMIVLGCVLALAVAMALAWIELPGYLAERAVAGLGITCVPLSITVSRDLSHASIAPTECTVPEGPIASFTLPTGAEIGLSRGRPRTIDIAMVAVNPRLAETTAIVLAVLVGGDTPDPLRRALGLFARAATHPDLPDVTVGEIDLGRGDVLALHQLVVRRHPDGVSVNLAAATPPAYHGSAIDLVVTVEDIAAQTTPSTASVTGHFEVHASIVGFAIDRSIAFRLTGSALDGPHATYDLWIEPSPTIDWLRAHASDLLQRIQAAGGAPMPAPATSGAPIRVTP